MILIIRKLRIYKVDEFGVRNYHNTFLVFLALLLLITSMTLFSAALLHFEATSNHANINNFSDALWTMFMTSSTIGFGDHYPVTNGGRLVTGIMFFVGFGLVGFIVTKILGSVIGFTNTNVRNRELRKQNAEILERNKLLERKVDSLISILEKVRN